MKYTVGDDKEGSETSKKGGGQAGDNLGPQHLAGQMGSIQEAGAPEREIGVVLSGGIDRSGAGSEVIYALKNASDETIYIGKTGNPKHRLATHRLRLGARVTMEIIQDKYFDETPGEAERKWVRRYRQSGAALLNSRLVEGLELVDKDPAKQFFREMGRVGGLKGSRVVANRLSAEERTARARKAAMARWASESKGQATHNK